MAIFALTFRIHEDAGYADRYNSVVLAIKQCSHTKYWDEPTSFFLIENPSTSKKSRSMSMRTLRSPTPRTSCL